RIVEADVERALAERMAQFPPRKVLRRISYDGMRRTIGERLGHSHTTAVPVTLTTEADVTELLALRVRLNEGVPKRDEISVTALIVKAAAQTLKRYPRLNSSLEGDEIVEWGEIHVGVAVALEDGLLVPVVRDADQKTVGQINAEIRELARKAEKGTLGPDEVSGSTFTVTNLGMYGVDAFTPVINPPEAAILGVGRTVSRPELRDGQLVLRQVTTLSLTFDHRLVDGAPAAQFLSSLRESLERPYGLVR
ncbi:MAG: dihydrolipoamide acetyltransferase family protein, partial [Bacillota bacterium]